jgi:hypothetical protein
MGNDKSRPHNQITSKICMKCNENNILNEDLTILNIFTGKDKYSRALLLRCSKGHILRYDNNIPHINTCIKEITYKEKSKSEIDVLKKENSLLKEEIVYLKEEIEFLKNRIEPSAPHLVEAELMKF